MRCACETLTRLDGVPADLYARDHLKQVSVDFESWTTEYVCEATGTRWIKDSLHPEAHGGGSPRLRQLDKDGQPIDEYGFDPFS